LQWIAVQFKIILGKIKPFAEAYIFLSTKSESDFVNESVKLAYQSWFELYNALKEHKTEEKKRFSNGKSLTIKIYFFHFIN